MIRRSLPVALALVCTAATTAAPPLRLLATIALPGVAGRIDHLAIDIPGQRLFVAALGNNSLEVVDVKTLSHVRSVKGLHEPQGVAYLPGAGQIVIANGEGGEVQFRDAGDFHVIRRLEFGDDADNVRYDAKEKRVLVGYGSGAVGVIAEADGKRIGDVKVAGHPESFQLEREGSRAFVNVPTAGQIAVIDRDAMRILATWPVTSAASNFPMALDERGHRLFIACRRPAKVLQYDTSSGKLSGSIETIGDADDLFYDTVRNRLYVTGGDGSVDVLKADGATPAALARIPTAPGARTSLFVQEQNRLYVAAPHRGSRDAAILVFETQD